MNANDIWNYTGVIEPFWAVGKQCLTIRDYVSCIRTCKGWKRACESIKEWERIKQLQCNQLFIRPLFRRFIFTLGVFWDLSSRYNQEDEYILQALMSACQLKLYEKQENEYLCNLSPEENKQLFAAALIYFNKMKTCLNESQQNIIENYQDSFINFSYGAALDMKELRKKIFNFEINFTDRFQLIDYLQLVDCVETARPIVDKFNLYCLIDPTYKNSINSTNPTKISVMWKYCFAAIMVFLVYCIYSYVNYGVDCSRTSL